MKKLIAIGTFVAFSAAGSAFSGTRVEIRESDWARAEAFMLHAAAPEGVDKRAG